MSRLTKDARPPQSPRSTALTLPIDRCRELLGDEADSFTDEDVDEIRQHAARMARLLIEIYLRQPHET